MVGKPGSPTSTPPSPTRELRRGAEDAGNDEEEELSDVLPCDPTASTCQSLLTPLTRGHEDTVLAILVHGGSLFSASRDNTIMHWWLETGHCHSILRGHTQQVTHLTTLMGDDDDPGNKVLSASGDGTVRVWRTWLRKTHDDMFTMAPFTVSAVRSLDVSPGEAVHGVVAAHHGRLICTAGDRGVSLWRYGARSKTVLKPLRRLDWQFGVQGPLFIEDGLLWARGSGNVVAWRLPAELAGAGLVKEAVKGKVMDMLPDSVWSSQPDLNLEHDGIVTAILPGGPVTKFGMLFSATESGQVWVWARKDKRTNWENISQLEGHTAAVTAIALTASVDADVHQSMVSRFRRQFKRPNVRRPIVFHGDQPRLFTASADGHVRIWVLHTWEKLGVIQARHPCTSLVLKTESALGSFQQPELLVIASLDRPDLPMVRSWDSETGELMRDFRRSRQCELLSPIIILLILLAQTTSFATRLLLPWNDRELEPRTIRSLLGGINLFGSAYDPPRYVNLSVAAFLAAFAILVSFSSFHDTMQRWREQVEEGIPADLHRQSTAAEGKPKANKAGVNAYPGKGGGYARYYCGAKIGRRLLAGSDGHCGPTNGPQCKDCRGLQVATSSALRFRLRALTLVIKAVRFITPLLSSILVVTITKVLAFYLACSVPFLSREFPTAPCFSPDHRPIGVCLGVLLMLYLWLVIAAAGVEGDQRYIGHDVIFNPSSWPAISRKKANVLNLGHLMHSGDNAFVSNLSLLALLVGLPLCEITSKSSRLHCGLSYFALVLTCSLVRLRKEAYLFKKANRIHLGTVLSVDWVFFVAALHVGLLRPSEATNAGDRPAPQAIWAAMFAGLFAIWTWTACAVRRAKAGERAVGMQDAVAEALLCNGPR